jgi:integrase
VRKLPPNIEEARGYEGYIAHLRDLDGKQYSKSFAVTNSEIGSDAEAFKQATAWLANEKAKKRRGQPGGRKNRATLRVVAEAWYEHGVNNENWKASTKRDYRYVVDSLMDDDSPVRIASGDAKLDNLTVERIRAWQTQLLKDGVGRRTVEKARMVLGSIFEHARLEPFNFDRNPVREVKPPKQKKRAPLNFYTVSDVEALVRAAESEQDGAIFLTAALTGLRRGELIALRVANVDFKRHKIHVEGSYVLGEASSTKSGEPRPVPMALVPEDRETLDVAKKLATLITKRANARGENISEDELVFPAADGPYAYQDGSALRRRYVKARDKAGLAPHRFHDLRHVFGSLAIQEADIVKVQEWMGHSHVETTMRYLHYKSSIEDAKKLGIAFTGDTPLNGEPSEPTIAERLAELERQQAELLELARAGLKR